ncbi:uncharacterized protein RAG0_04969 [Rhynchosporium agropyri]|uniref:Ribonuclease H1 N-terminal domain-containing protein n=1 Tax=Rhynchosporium agropyri TaxID=914238 RepID=A0A1E1KBA7_9HELO|nr:uncharacterized protein RAG0_04969 [Rhynchosporium agropyri]
MSVSHKHVVFIVFRGKTPGVYYSQEECQQQTEGFPKSKFQAFRRANDAEVAWSECTSSKTTIRGRLCSSGADVFDTPQ